MLTLTENDAKTPRGALDYFHINSVDKDAVGNYIISARHTHAIMCISPKGETLWVLGGKNNTFQDLSDDRAVDFTWQHHARLHDNNRLSIFDNGKSESKDYVAEYSRGMLVSLDTEHMTAILLREFADPNQSKLAQSQGSAQAIENSGNWLVSYGSLPTFTEFGENGQVVSDVDIAPRLICGAGMVTSYRAFKTRKGVGRPVQPPDAFLRPSEGVLYASWHGATEIDRWILEGADWKGVDGNDYIQLETKKKDAFEVSFAIEGTMPPFLRVVALDRDGGVLGHTDVLHRESDNASSTKLREWLIRGGVVLVILIVALVFRKRIKRMLKSGGVTKAAGLIQRNGWWQDRRTVSPHEVQRLYNG
ncbi:hypothetical protein DL770_004425 [Monosporascus sp. CRB-9-2]|nr:hypothetical protein DL770_004425 [Monosporascus sp. CRB-9-2]